MQGGMPAFAQQLSCEESIVASILDPSHRNEVLSISGKSGSKGKDIIWHWNQCAYLFLEKTKCSISFQLRFLSALCVFLQDWVTLRTDILPKQGQATGTAGFLLNLEPRIYLLLSRSPSGRPRRSCREGNSVLHCPGPRAQSSEPQTCCVILHRALWLGLVCPKISVDGWGQY